MRSGVPVPSYHSRASGGAGVAGLTTADGGDAIGNEEVIRGDGGTGIQGSLAQLSDTGVLQIIQSGSADEKVKLDPATPRLNLGSDVPIAWHGDPDIGSAAADAGLKRSAAGVVEATNGGAGAGALKAGNLKLATNTLSSEDANGNIALTPNGTGQVLVPAGSGSPAVGGGIRFGTGAGTDVIVAATANDGIGVTNAGGSALAIKGGSAQFYSSTSRLAAIWVDAVTPTGLRLASGLGVAWTSSATDAASGADTGIFRAAAADIAFGNGTAGNAAATLKFGGGRCRGLTSSAGAASTTEYPTDGDWGLHKNTTTGVTSIVRNDAGAIKSAALA